MKPYYILVAILLMGRFTYAKTAFNIDTTKSKAFTSIERVPEFPGGIPALINYIGNSVKYPDVARLIGINGKVVVSFVVDTTGRVTNVMPVNCIGAGCEAEAARVLENSPQWLPGIQNGRPVRVQYSVPINFSVPVGKIYFKDLQKSNYGFVFEIKGRQYTISEAQEILGSGFESDEVQIAEPFFNADHNKKFNIAGKKGVYLVKMKIAPAASN
ncbi:energy transducer TonB [Mucilaginibacter sp. CAU 1740]|uniref:energy transducer TonB n=1 Tax=Mucilaginibacter sp. CAU 1740 TaxID=3140365 RepID=UPI00325B81F2